MEVKIAWGLHESGNLYHITEVERGANCSCYCPNCKSPLIARQGKKLAWCFAHNVETNCNGESVIHYAAKQIILNAAKSKQNINLPPIKILLEDVDAFDDDISVSWKSSLTTFNIFNANDEVKIDNIITDALCLDENGNVLAVEIFCKHKKSDLDIKKFIKSRLDSIEIDLSSVEWNTSRSELENIVLKSAPRKWLFNNSYVQNVNKLNLDIKSVIKESNISKFAVVSDNLKSLIRNNDYNNFHGGEIIEKISLFDKFGNNIEHKEVRSPKVTKILNHISIPNSDYLILRATIENKTNIRIYVTTKNNVNKIIETKPYILMIVKQNYLYNEFEYEFEYKTKWCNILKWKERLSTISRRNLEVKIRNLEKFIDYFVSANDLEKLEIIKLKVCRKLNIENKVILINKKRYQWNTTDAIWKLLLFFYYIDKNDSVDSKTLSESKWISSLLNYPNDEKSQIRRSKDIYFWLRDKLAANGIVKNPKQLTFDVASKKRKIIKSIDDLI